MPPYQLGTAGTLLVYFLFTICLLTFFSKLEKMRVKTRYRNYINVCMYARICMYESINKDLSYLRMLDCIYYCELAACTARQLADIFAKVRSTVFSQKIISLFDVIPTGTFCGGNLWGGWSYCYMM